MDNQHIGSTGKPNNFSKGIVTDASLQNQPAGSYRYARNYVWGTKEGDRDSLATEHGNEQCYQLPEGFLPIGREYLNPTDKVVFAVNQQAGESIIARVTESCQTEVLVRSRCLNFNIEHQIKVEYRVRLGCEDVLYFTDDYNPPRTVNITDLKQFHTEEYAEYLKQGKDPDDYPAEKWDCTKFELFRPYEIPYVENALVLSGGQHKSGSVNFAVRLLDEDFNPVPFGPESGTVNLYRDYTPSTKAYQKVLGSSNVEVDPFGGTLNSGKSIDVKVANLDTRYAYWQLAVAEAISLTGEVTNYWLSPPITIETDTFTVTGDYSTFIPLTIDEWRALRPDIKKAKTVTQQENRLLLGNTQGREYDVCGFQRFASKICTEFIEKEVPIDDIHSVGDAKNPNTFFDLGSFQGDEVVPNGIVYIWDTGDETPVYHIPGPPLDKLTCAEGATTLVQRTCHYVKFILGFLFQCEDISYTVTFEVDGQEQTITGITGAQDEEEIQIYCGTGNYSLVITGSTVECAGPQYVDDPPYGIVSYSKVEPVSYGGPAFGLPCATINSAGALVENPSQVEDGWDSSIIEEWSETIRDLAPEFDEAGVPYALWPDSRKVQRWQLENTAIRLTNRSGRPGYYACRNATYPDIRDCENKSIWGEDACGNPLVGTPIRHPRMPDRRTSPLVTSASADTYQDCLVVTFRVTGGSVRVRIYYTEGGDGKFIDIVLPETPDNDTNSITVICSEENLAYVDHEVLVFVDDEGNSDQGELQFFSATVHESILTEAGTRLARILGLRFSNIEYPHPDIVGHYFVTAIREDKDKTVIDAGIVGRTKQAAGNIGFSYFTRGNTYGRIGYFLTPEFLVEAKETQGNQLAYQGQFKFTGKELACVDLDGAGSVFQNVDTIIDVRRQRYGEYVIPTDQFSPIDEVLPLNAISYESDYTPEGDLVNLSLTNRIQLLRTQTGIPKDGDDIFYAYSRVYRDVYCDLFGIVYRNNTRRVLTLNDDQEVYGGDTYITPFNLNNTLLRSIYDSYWDDALKVILIATATVGTILTAGAAASLFGLLSWGTALAIGSSAVLAGVVGVSVATVQAIKERYKSRQYSQLANDAELNGGCSNDFLEDSFIAYANERIENIYVESQINFGLRQEIVGECGNLYKGDDLLQYFRTRITNYNPEEGKYEPKGVICPEVYWINPDFSRVNKEKLYVPVPRSFKCCSKCLEDHSGRWYWSEQSFQEERVDNFRVFLPNNYKDIDHQHGGITEMVPYYQNLLIMSEDNLWVSIGSIQERVAGDVVTFLGTGEAYSVPERKALDDDLGSVGCQHQWGVLKTRYGVFIADEKENSLYLYSSGVKDVFVGLVKAWAHENFKGHLAESLKTLTGDDLVHYDNHANPDGVGIHMTYDPMFRRILITKRDYEIIPETIGRDPKQAYTDYGLPIMYYEYGAFWYYDQNGRYKKVRLGDPRYFRDRSFTLSYYPERKQFCSFHSYVPLMYFRDKNTFFSSIGSDIWEHNKDNVLSFYGVDRSAILEGVDNDSAIVDKFVDYLMFLTQAKRNAGMQGVTVNDKTFTSVIVYNSAQSTGQLELKFPEEEAVLVEVVTEDTDKIVVGKRGRDSYINDLWDVTRGQETPLFRDDWDSIQADYPIDKVPNVAIGDAISEWDELVPLSDKYVVYRFFYETDDDTTLVVHHVVPGAYVNPL